MLHMNILLRPSCSIEEIQNLYKKPLVLVESLRLEHAKNDYKAMCSLCSCFHELLPGLIKKLRTDIKCVQCAIKKGRPDLQGLCEQLQDLCSYLKNHRLIYNAISVHNEISKTYQLLFDMIDNNQDIIVYIDEHKEFFNIEHAGHNYLNIFLKNVKKMSNQVSKFEDYVHSDYIDLKMQNYVFKIELIKLRNAILFDKRYKH